MTESERKETAKKWFDLGKLYAKYEKENNKIFVEFIMYWVAFNCLYNSCVDSEENNRIRAYCKQNMSLLKEYNAFEKKQIEILKKSPICNMWRKISTNRECCKKTEKICKKRHDNLLSDNEDEKISALFQTMYQVRCNLFHGGKSPSDDRDRELVQASAVILSGYLEVLLKDSCEMSKNGHF